MAVLHLYQMSYFLNTAQILSDSHTLFFKRNATEKHDPTEG